MPDVQWGNVAEWGAVVVGAGAVWGARALLKQQSAALADAENERLEREKDTDRELGLLASQTATGRETLRASLRPMLVDVPAGSAPVEEKVHFADGRTITMRRDWVYVNPEVPAGGHLKCSVPFRNVGPGPAVITGCGVKFGDGSIGWGADLSSALVQPQEIVRVTSTVPTDRRELEPYFEELRQQWTMEVSYLNVGGGDRLRSVAFIHERPGGVWRVRQWAVYEGTSTEPFVMSAPADA